MADPGQEIADAIVTHLNAQDLGFGFAAASPEDPQKEINFDGMGDPHVGTKCFVIPVADSEEKIDKAGVIMSPTINVFVSRFLSGKDGVTRRVMDDFVHDIRTTIRFVQMAGYHSQGTETVTKYDPDKLRTQDRFFAVLALSYVNVE